MWINICDREPYTVKKYDVKIDGVDGYRPTALWSNGAFWINGERVPVCQWWEAV